MKPSLALALVLAFAGGAAAVFGADLALRRLRGSASEFARAARLRERVKDEVATLVSHADAIEVTVDGGLVRVSGYVLTSEQDALLAQLTRLPGVHKVHNALSAVADARRLNELLERALAESDDLGLQTQAYSGA